MRFSFFKKKPYVALTREQSVFLTCVCYQAAMSYHRAISSREDWHEFMLFHKTVFESAAQKALSLLQECLKDDVKFPKKRLSKTRYKILRLFVKTGMTGSCPIPVHSLGNCKRLLVRLQQQVEAIDRQETSIPHCKQVRVRYRLSIFSYILSHYSYRRSTENLILRRLEYWAHHQPEATLSIEEIMKKVRR